jgi:regulatory protein
LYYKLEEGIELSTEKYNYIIEETVFSKARDKAVRYLSYSARSRKEVYDKLKSTEEGFSDEIIDRVITLMERYGYIDDYRFSVSYIKDKSGINGFGSDRIRYALKEKGVHGDIIENAFGMVDIDEPGNALKLLEKKYKTKKITEIREKKKAHEFLLRKGYNYEIISEVIDRFIEQGN